MAHRASPLRVSTASAVSAARVGLGLVSALWLVSALLLFSSASCGSLGRVETCGEIAEHGCPIGRGGTCDDQLCEALYDCVDGSWAEVEKCERVIGSGGGGGGGAGGGGGGCQAVDIDRTGEQFGCLPGLLEPDCPVAATEICDPCSTGCVDFWMCTDEGWEAVAYCDESGVFIADGVGG